MLNSDEKMIKGFMRLPEVLGLIPISKSKWYEGIQEEIFPKPIKLGERIAVWRAQDIFDLIDEISRQGDMYV